MSKHSKLSQKLLEDPLGPWGNLGSPRGWGTPGTPSLVVSGIPWGSPGSPWGGAAIGRAQGDGACRRLQSICTPFKGTKPSAWLNCRSLARSGLGVIRGSPRGPWDPQGCKQCSSCKKRPHLAPKGPLWGPWGPGKVQGRPGTFWDVQGRSGEGPGKSLEIYFRKQKLRFGGNL